MYSITDIKRGKCTSKTLFTSLFWDFENEMKSAQRLKIAHEEIRNRKFVVNLGCLLREQEEYKILSDIRN